MLQGDIVDILKYVKIVTCRLSSLVFIRVNPLTMGWGRPSGCKVFSVQERIFQLGGPRIERALRCSLELPITLRAYTKLDLHGWRC